MPIALYKPQGWSPLQALDALRIARTEYRHAVLGYAGRLDPMAEGVLLVTVDGENREADRWRALEKEYRVRVLFGVATDTFDALGRIAVEASDTPVDRDGVRRAVAAMVGSFEQELPPFSAARYAGRSRFHWARAGIAVPRRAHTRTVRAADVIEQGTCGSEALREQIRRRIGRVCGDFRQAEIVAGWDALFAHVGERHWPTASLRVECSSGTFMRSLADALGRWVGSAAIALEIVRTRVGEYHASEALRLE